MSDGDRRRSAFHEAGHAVMARLLFGEPPQVVSLRPGAAYSAVCIGQSRPFPTEWKQHAPSILQPATLRNHAEADIAMSLAGDLAANMAGFATSGYGEAPDEQAARASARALSELSPRARELLEVAEKKTDALSDWTLAHRVSWLFTGSEEESVAHVAWVKVLAQRLLLAHEDALTRVADSLVLSEFMGPEKFEALVSESRCTCHSFRVRSTPLAGSQQEQPAAALVAAVAEGSQV